MASTVPSDVLGDATGAVPVNAILSGAAMTGTGHCAPEGIGAIAASKASS